MAIPLDPATKDVFWKAAHWQEDLDWVQAYWVELEALYNSTYRERALISKQLVAPRETRRRQEPSLDDVMNRIHSGQLSDQPLNDMDDADGELIDYR
jgi:hypothetical protein